MAKIYGSMASSMKKSGVSWPQAAYRRKSNQLWRKKYNENEESNLGIINQ
jgi:hypothetical protein